MTTSSEQTTIDVDTAPITTDTAVITELAASSPSPLAAVNTTVVDESVVLPPSPLAEVNTTIINEPVVSPPSPLAEVNTNYINEPISSTPSPTVEVSTSSYINEPVNLTASAPTEVNTNYINEPISSTPSPPIEANTNTYINDLVNLTTSPPIEAITNSINESNSSTASSPIEFYANSYINSPVNLAASPPTEVNTNVINNPTPLPSPPPSTEVKINDQKKSTAKPVETVEVVTKEPTQTIVPGHSEPIQKNIILTLWGSYKIFFAFLITSALTIVQLVIGLKYSEQCPISWRIPHYLVVVGVIGCVIIGIQIVECVLALCLRSQVTNNQMGFSSILLVCAVCGMGLGLLSLSVFLFGWHIAGFVWVLRVWSDVSFKDPNSSTYCHPVLYRFTFWLLFIGLIYSVFSCVKVCLTVPRKLQPNTKGTHQRVPTSEP